MANTGTHVGNLWTSTGSSPATGTFTGEAATGLAASELLDAGADHGGHDLRRPYLAPNGYYADDQNYFSSQ